MNRYGAEALEHWRAYLPASYGRVQNPEEFFILLGEQADAEIEDRYLEYAGPDAAGESAEDKQARRRPCSRREQGLGHGRGRPCGPHSSDCQHELVVS